MKTPKLYSVSEVAKMFSVGDRTVRRWLEQGDLKHFRLGTGHQRVSRDHIDEFISANERSRELVMA